MEALLSLSSQESQALLALSSAVPASTNLDYVVSTLKEAFVEHEIDAAVGLWLPQPLGFVPVTEGADAAFSGLVSSRSLEAVIQEGGDWTPVANGYRFPLTANRQVLGQLLVGTDRSREPYYQALAASLAPVLGALLLALQLSEEVAKRTSTDKLTGLWNRQYFNERFREECERLVRSKETGSVALISLDQFEALAKTMAPEEQQQMFANVGSAVRQVIRQTDWGVRWDGFDLLFYFPSTGADAAVEVMKRFCRKILTYSPILEPLAGISSTAETTSPRALIQLAQRRLDLARKDGGRRVICFATPGGGLQFFREPAEA